MISFFVRGAPKGQPRPRAFARKFGDKWSARVYDAGTAEGWKSLVAVAYRETVGAVIAPIHGPVRLEVTFWMARPKSHRGAHGLKPSAPKAHVQKPDLDNLEKAVMDALTQIGAWLDDAQVCEKVSRRMWVPEDGGCEGAHIVIFEIKAE